MRSGRKGFLVFLFEVSRCPVVPQRTSAELVSCLDFCFDEFLLVLRLEHPPGPASAPGLSPFEGGFWGLPAWNRYIDWYQIAE